MIEKIIIIMGVILFMLCMIFIPKMLEEGRRKRIREHIKYICQMNERDIIYLINKKDTQFFISEGEFEVARKIIEVYRNELKDILAKERYNYNKLMSKMSDEDYLFVTLYNKVSEFDEKGCIDPFNLLYKQIESNEHYEGDYIVCDRVYEYNPEGIVILKLRYLCLKYCLEKRYVTCEWHLSDLRNRIESRHKEVSKTNKL